MDPGSAAPTFFAPRSLACLVIRLGFLGTSAAAPTKERNVSAVALQVGARIILFDCGEGTQRQFMSSDMSFMKVERVCISHLHADHYLGLAGLIQTMTLSDRVDPLYIHVPAGAEGVIQGLATIGGFQPGFPIHIQGLEPGADIAAEDLRIRTAATDHSLPSLAYRIDLPKRSGRFDRDAAIAAGVPEGPLWSQLQRGEQVEVEGRTVTPEGIVGAPRPGMAIVYSGDTAPSPAVIDLAKDADILIHEATFGDEEVERAAELRHSTARQAAQVARDAGVGFLLLTHISSRYDDASGLLTEAKEVFDQVHIPKDLDIIQVKADPT